MPYVPDVDDDTLPANTDEVFGAAAELRALKTKLIAELISIGNYTDAGDAATLVAAKEYADIMFGWTPEDVEAAYLAVASFYTQTQTNQMLSDARLDIDTTRDASRTVAIDTAIAATGSLLMFANEDIYEWGYYSSPDLTNEGLYVPPELRPAGVTHMEVLLSVWARPTVVTNWLRIKVYAGTDARPEIGSVSIGYKSMYYDVVTDWRWGQVDVRVRLPIHSDGKVYIKSECGYNNVNVPLVSNIFVRYIGHYKVI